MSETVAVVVDSPEAPEAEGTDTTETFDEQRAREALAKKNSENQGLRKRLKELEGYEAKVREAEEANKSESQKLADRAAKAEQRAQQVESELIRERIARRHGITDDDLDLLGSGTEEQIEARAKRLSDLTAAAKGADVKAPPSDRSREHLRPGATPAAAPEATADAYPSSWRTARTAQTRKD